MKAQIDGQVEFQLALIALMFSSSVVVNEVAVVLKRTSRGKFAGTLGALLLTLVHEPVMF